MHELLKWIQADQPPEKHRIGSDKQLAWVSKLQFLEKREDVNQTQMHPNIPYQLGGKIESTLDQLCSCG